MGTILSGKMKAGGLLFPAPRPEGQPGEGRELSPLLLSK